MSNIWTAASEGNFERVRELVEGGMHPAIPDENTYTPLHAAASWAHPDILRYLVEKGGSINTTDEDGETPLFVVETTEMAALVVELGGDPRWKNAEGVTPAESLQEDYPHIASYLRDLTGEAAPLPVSITEQDEPEEADMADVSISSNTTNPDLDAPTDALMGRVREIMEASERGELSAQETDDRLREVVGQAVDGQVAAGREIGEAMEEDESGGKREAEEGEGEVKRRREEPAR